MLSLKVVRLQYVSRIVFQIECDDNVRPALDGSCHDVAIIRVRQGDYIDQRLIACDEAVFRVGVHQISQQGPLGRVYVRPVRRRSSDPLLMDGACPARAEHLRGRELQQQVAERHRVEHIRIK